MLSTMGRRDVIEKIENEAWVDAFAYAAISRLCMHLLT
jgi:hypothetical protein